MNILVTSSSFGEKNKKPLELLEKLNKFNIIYNHTGNPCSKRDLIKLLKKYNPLGIISGTETYDSEVLNHCKDLRIISRVGIGLDSIDLSECKKRRIIVKNTPGAPTNAVAEITLGQMINLSRRIQETDKNMRNGIWKRHIGREINDSVIGIIGCGRIGSSVFKKLSSFNPKKVLVNDIKQKKANALYGATSVSKEELIRKSDIITIHIPLNKENKNYFSKKEFNLAKKNLILLNFSRGGVVNEEELYKWLNKNPPACAAIDVFTVEPYSGKLANLENCYVTPHLGSCSDKSRLCMELGAVLNLIKNLSPCQ